MRGARVRRAPPTVITREHEACLGPDEVSEAMHEPAGALPPIQSVHQSTSVPHRARVRTRGEEWAVHRILGRHRVEVVHQASARAAPPTAPDGRVRKVVAKLCHGVHIMRVTDVMCGVRMCNKCVTNVQDTRGAESNVQRGAKCAGPALPRAHESVALRSPCGASRWFPAPS